jgi:hypothetical protein
MTGFAGGLLSRMIFYTERAVENMSHKGHHAWMFDETKRKNGRTRTL